MKTKALKRKITNRLAPHRDTPHPTGLRLKVIVVPIDFSAESKKALRYACKLAEQFGAELRLIHVVEPVPFLNDLTNVPLSRSDRDIAKEAFVKLQALAQ